MQSIGGDKTNLADAPACVQELKCIHVEHQMGVISLALHPACDLIERITFFEHLGSPDRKDTAADRDIFCVKDVTGDLREFIGSHSEGVDRAAEAV